MNSNIVNANSSSNIAHNSSSSGASASNKSDFIERELALAQGELAAQENRKSNSSTTASPNAVNSSGADHHTPIASSSISNKQTHSSPTKQKQSTVRIEDQEAKKIIQNARREKLQEKMKQKQNKKAHQNEYNSEPENDHMYGVG
jgi:hypothetical protein